MYDILRTILDITNATKQCLLRQGASGLTDVFFVFVKSSFIKRRALNIEFSLGSKQTEASDVCKRDIGKESTMKVAEDAEAC